MKIAAKHSRLDGLEFLLVHKPEPWGKLQAAVTAVDTKARKTSISKEKRTAGTSFYSPVALNRTFKDLLDAKGWSESRIGHSVTQDAKLIRKTLTLPADGQKRQSEDASETPIYSRNQTDFVKERVAVEVQFGRRSFVAYDLLVKYLAFYIGDPIDVGIEILPMKTRQAQMSPGIAYDEGELYNVVHQGRGVPAVPLVIAGVEA